MSTAERVDAVAEEVKEDAAQNKDDIIAALDAKFRKLPPVVSNRTSINNKWADTNASGSGDYYKCPYSGARDEMDGKAYQRTSGILLNVFSFARFACKNASTKAWTSTDYFARMTHEGMQLDLGPSPPSAKST